MIKRFLNIIILSLVVFNYTKAQVILPLGQGQSFSTGVVCSNNDKLWVITKSNSTFEVKKWDGNFWLNLPKITSSYIKYLSNNIDSISAKSLFYFKNELYLALTNNNGKLLIIKNKGNFWEKINTDNIFSEKNLKFITTGNELLLCGKFNYNSSSISILNVEGLACKVYASNHPDQGIDDYFTDFEYSNNKIWAIGLFATPFDPYNKAFKVFENNVWKNITSSPYNNGFEGFGKFNDSLIVTGVDYDGYINFSLKSNNWKEISNGLYQWKIMSVSDIHQVKNILWVSGKFVNETTKKTASIAYWNGNVWTVPNIDYIGNDVKIYGENEVYISGSFVTHQGLILNKTGKILHDKALLTGKVFYDNNQNCTQEFDENNLQEILVKIMPENVYIPTDYNGRFFIPVEPEISQHIVNIETPKYYISTCGTKIVNTSDQLTNAGLDFGIIPYGSHYDVSVSVSDFTGWRARLGFDENYRICITNRGNQNINEAILEFTPDNLIQFTEFSIVPFSYKQNKIIWKINSLNKGETICILAKAKIPVELQLGNKICHKANVILNELNDDDRTNNFDTLTQKLVAAIDPNDKTTKQDYKISTQTSSIDYKIRFQNTGIDTAYNIQIIDTLDPNFVISANKGVIMSSSHNYELAPIAWLQNGKYRYKYAWIFRNVLLPDKKVNEELSNGFIDFKINLKDKLEVGTNIKNRAYIYFDFQEAVITNDAVNIVSNSASVKNLKASKIKIHPNPAHNYITIENTDFEKLTIQVENILGKSVLNVIVEPQSKKLIDVSEFSKGIYFICTKGFAPIKFFKD
ncbi:MAG: T9SS type A sorting domain-containing protein [Bacteroidia bacterium]|nr:T9SS type A sorting domain-containing protein [Bacteroidia bacterium]